MFKKKDIELSQKHDFILYLIINYDCNLRCKYCFVDKLNGSKLDFDLLDNLVVFLNEYVDSRNIQIDILGGEPFLYKDLLIKTINYLNDNVVHDNFSFYISTNGILVNEKLLEDIKKNKAKIEVAFSIDGDIDTINIGRFDGKNEKLSNLIVSNFLLAKSILGRENVSITMTICTETLPFFSKNLKFLFSLNPYLLRFRLSSGDNWNLSNMKEYLTVFKHYYLYYIDKIYLKKDNKNFPVIEQFEQMINIKSDNLGPCSKGVNLTLTPDGFFVPCYNYLQKEILDGAKFPINIKELVENKKYDEEFMNWRVKTYSSNNGCKDKDGENLNGRFNFSTCIPGDYKGKEKDEIIDAWKYKEEKEKDMGLKIFKFIYEKYGINLYKESLTYNKK